MSVRIPRQRCPWVDDDPLLIHDHDTSWGVPIYESNTLWGLLALEAFQAGLSWKTVLHKRAALRKAFHDFAPTRVAKMNSTDVERLLRNDAIIRSRIKIEATIKNAQAFLQMKKDGIDFAHWLWSMNGDKPSMGDGRLHPSTATSTKMSTALRKKGFKFCGPVLVYAFMQACGMVNDHAHTCFRRKEIASSTAFKHSLGR